MRWPFREIMATFRDELLLHSPSSQSHDRILYAHFRSGDVFKRIPHPHYGQPPCQYYTDAIRMDKEHDVVEMTAEDYAIRA